MTSRLVPTACLLVLAAAPLSAQGDPHMEVARRVLRSSPLIDGHNDLPWLIREKVQGRLDAYDLRHRTPGHTDLERLRAGMLGGQTWSVYIPGEIKDSGYARVQLE